MLQSIQDYVQFAPDGLSILSESVKRRFPKDDTFVPWDDPRAYACSNTIAEIIQEILQRHVDGISFREHDAGPNLDMQMSDEGFNIEVHVDWETGFIFGGNQHNCGTWMDKMGESVKAGTKGVPGTPRDGAPIEITGLLKSTLHWLNGLSNKGLFPFKGVQANGKSLHVYRYYFFLIRTPSLSSRRSTAPHHLQGVELFNPICFRAQLLRPIECVLSLTVRRMKTDSVARPCRRSELRSQPEHRKPARYIQRRVWFRIWSRMVGLPAQAQLRNRDDGCTRAV